MSGELRRDPLSGRLVVVAPGRASRPGAGAARLEPATAEELDSCPFCEGREDRTPPETLALPEREPPDSPGWRVRVVPNLYPAFERQEVVVHSADHKRSFAELDDEEVALVAEAWQRRRASHPEGYLHALINEGRAAGASLAHSHSQLVWMETEPPQVVAEGDVMAGVWNLLKEIHADWPSKDYEVETFEDVFAFCPPASRAPYEMLITVEEFRDPRPFEAEFLAMGLLVLRNVVRRLRTLEGDVPWNAWLHAKDSWHIELVPRLGVFAGVELGAGVYINTLDPLEAAKRLREAL